VSWRLEVRVVVEFCKLTQGGREEAEIKLGRYAKHV
jgi:hypothetical protein